MESRCIKIKVADTVFSVEPRFSRSYNMCEDYICQGASAFHIRCTYEDYDREKEIYEREYHDTAPGDIQLETFSILHKVADELIEHDAILFHGAAIALKDSAFVFSAKSGTGKTTHILKWLDSFPEAYVINGDKPFLKFSHGYNRPLVCGSPWAGKEKMQTNTMVPLDSIVFIERAEDNRIEQISFANAFPHMLSQVYRPIDEGKMRKTIRLMKRFSQTVTFWRFYCNNFKDDCLDVAYHALVSNRMR